MEVLTLLFTQVKDLGLGLVVVTLIITGWLIPRWVVADIRRQSAQERHNHLVALHLDPNQIQAIINAKLGA